MDWVAVGGTRRYPQRLLYARCPIHNGLAIRRLPTRQFIAVCKACEAEAIRAERKVRRGKWRTT